MVHSKSCIISLCHCAVDSSKIRSYRHSAIYDLPLGSNLKLVLKSFPVLGGSLGQGDGMDLIPTCQPQGGLIVPWPLSTAHNLCGWNGHLMLKTLLSMGHGISQQCIVKTWYLWDTFLRCWVYTRPQSVGLYMVLFNAQGISDLQGIGALCGSAST